MKLLITLLLLLPTIVFTARAQDEKIYPVLDKEPVYPGGIDSMKAFLARTIVYPLAAIEKGIEGKVYLSFTVGMDGTITNPIVRRGVAGCPECDAEAIRAVKLMPKWIPGQLNSKNVESQYNLPVKFALPITSGTLPEEKTLPPVYKYVDEEPQFPGGTIALKRFLAENIIYPQRAKEAGITGKCYTQFIVAEDGTITDPVVKRGVPDCPECDAEAIRVIKLMPKWIPGKYNGKSDKAIYYLPIPFKMDE